MNHQHMLTPAPPMGWNSFDSYGVAASEKTMMDNLEAMAAKLKPFGYKYFVIDNGWFGEFRRFPGHFYPCEKHASDVRLDDYGRLIPSEMYFPNGLSKIIERTHELGLKFGIHLMRGIPRKAVELNLPIYGTQYRAADIADKQSICIWCHYMYGVDMDKPGAQEYYNSVVDLFAGWGVDFIKVDDITGYPGEIEAIANAIERCGRDIVLSLSPGGQVDVKHMPVYQRANMLRITTDIWDEREDLDKAFDAWHKFQGYQKDGFWLDLDMIPFGHLKICNPVPSPGFEPEGMVGKGYERMCRLNRNQMYTFITIRALAASPLFMGGDLLTSDDFSFSLITNTEMIRCNQNGIVGRNVFKRDGIEVWITPDKTNNRKGWIGIFNRNTEDRKLDLPLEKIFSDSHANYCLWDIWNSSPVTINNRIISCVLPADGVLFASYTRQIPE